MSNYLITHVHVMFMFMLLKFSFSSYKGMTECRFFKSILSDDDNVGRYNGYFIVLVINFIVQNSWQNFQRKKK